jgi:pimeloyl-ACP methyl ester carboxylesterase
VSTVETGGPTVVLVHGAFAGTDSWAGVVERLLNAGVPVKAVVNPRRALATDAAYVAGIVSQVPGPVVLVGHSYGGMVVTNAASQTTNVVGLVYVGALVPVEGETAADIIGRSADSLLNSAVLPNEYPAGSDTATEFIIDPARFRQVFAADLPQLQSDILAYFPAARRRCRPGRKERTARLEEPSFVGRRRHRRQSSRLRRRALGR